MRSQTHNLLLDAGGVYMITHLPSKRIYIGSTSNFRRRFQEHRDDLRLGRHSNWKLQRDYLRDGPSAFHFHVVEVVPGTQEQRLAREQYWMDRTRCYDTGYNILREAHGHLTRARAARVQEQVARREKLWARLARTLLGET